VTSIPALIAARTPGDPRSLQALAVALAATVHDTPEPSTDPTDLYWTVEDDDAEAPGTWQQVRAARDYGDLSPAEYEYLAAAVGALTQEKEQADG
jgi:hypothetical protein